MGNSDNKYCLISVLALTPAALEVIAPDIAKHGTIQPRKPGRSERGLRVAVHEDRVAALCALLGYQKRRRLVTVVRDITEELDEKERAAIKIELTSGGG